jgi:hypothetical protein
MQLQDLPPQKLRRPVESKRKSSVKPDTFTCDAVEQALVDYLGECAGAVWGKGHSMHQLHRYSKVWCWIFVSLAAPL